VNFSGAQLKRRVTQRVYAGIGFCDVVGFEQRHFRAFLFSLRLSVFA
jgi:hypothetical protein